ncbi:MAG: 4'-phosphopantetheinyl transferase superfamily protein [Clostridia bacterium]
MQVILNDAEAIKDIDKHVCLRDFSYLDKIYSMRNFQKVRRYLKDKMIADMLGCTTFIINQDFLITYSGNCEKRYSCSYCGYNIAVALFDNDFGIDIESYNKISEEKINIFSSQAELEIFRSYFKSRSTVELATFIWSIKESLGKLYKVGLSKGFQTFKFYERDGIFISTDLQVRSNDFYIYYKFYNNNCFVLSALNKLGGNQDGCEVNITP